MQLIIEEKALSRLHEYASKISENFCIISDTNLAKQANDLAAQLKKHKLVCHVLIIPAGEKSKTFSVVEKIISSLVKLNMRRDSAIIAFGGGVVGDVAGFVSSIYMRGIQFINIPTTVLAMADSSIGGKTGIDLDEGKNLVGSFYDPELLLMDPLLLKSLPDKEFRNGFAEIIKHAIIRDKKFFTFLEKNNKLILARNQKLLVQVLKKSTAIKMAIVKSDPRESITKAKSLSGKCTSRMLVNYGHTVGHAIEKASNYTISHGQAISMGMVAENRLAVEKNLLTEFEYEKIEQLLKLYGLPTRIPAQYADVSLKQYMLKDKKRVGKKLFFALPRKIGNATLVAFDQN